jgi:hypothetical protein
LPRLFSTPTFSNGLLGVWSDPIAFWLWATHTGKVA